MIKTLPVWRRARHASATRLNHSRYLLISVAAIGGLLLLGKANAEPVAECAGVTSPIEAWCGFQRPEDLEALGNALIIGEYGGLDGSMPGRMVRFVPESGERTVLYPNNRPVTRTAGDAGCPGPPGAAFAPHGIHIPPDESVLLAVNHGGREAIEIFAIEGSDDQTQFNWQGCVPLPDHVWANDVVALPDGAMAVTHMMPKGSNEEAILKAEAEKAPVGNVIEWAPDSGWHDVPGSEGALPNGIEVSADGGTLYVNHYFGDQVVALDRASGKTLWSVPASAPDNSAWTDDGILLVASHDHDLHTVFECNQHPLLPCAAAFKVVAIRASDGAHALIHHATGEEIMGEATVAVPFGGRIWFGSYVGDRIMGVPMPEIRFE